MLDSNMTIHTTEHNQGTTSRWRLLLSAIAFSLAAGCTADSALESCDALYSHHYGRFLVQASEDYSEPWRRAGFRSPSVWAHARANSVLEGARQSGRCR